MRGPISPLRVDALFSMVVQAIYQGYTKKGQKPPSIEKIMPKWGSGDDEPVDDSPEAQRARFTRAIGAVAPKGKPASAS